MFPCTQQAKVTECDEANIESFTLMFAESEDENAESAHLFSCYRSCLPGICSNFCEAEETREKASQLTIES